MWPFVRHIMVSEGPKIVMVVIFTIINVIFFSVTAEYYHNAPEYFYHWKMLGWNLPVARGAAACLNINCMLILFPICRNLVTMIRDLLTRCPFKFPRGIIRLFDENIFFHKYFAYNICIFTGIHICAHCFNLELFVEGWHSRHNVTSGLLSALSLLPVTPGDPYFNPVRSPHAVAALELWKLVAGVSGVVITFCLILIYSSATSTMRRSYFEAFWYTHHLFVLFYIGLCVHGIQGVVGPQDNLSQHNPSVCWLKFREWGSQKSKCALPQFKRGTPQTWKWLIVPLVCYAIERIVRFVRSCRNVKVDKVIFHPSRVLELQLIQDGFSAKPGQYIFIQCPQISRLEWHPFTLTSAPQDPYFSVHIRAVGDWTNKLLQLMTAADRDKKDYPSIRVDGPFGTATEDAFAYDVSLFIGTGIGVTPFASVLKNIWLRLRNVESEGSATGGLQGVYLVWICPEPRSFEWFGDLLCDLETQMTRRGRSDFLRLLIYLTRGWDGETTGEIVRNEFDERDCLTGLQQKTSFGRPNWGQIFDNVAAEHPNRRVGVFFCGPSVLARQILRQCEQHTSSTPGEIKFVFNKENF